MSKNIWIVNHYAIKSEQTGPTRTIDIAKELNKKGHNVTIFSSSFSHYTKKYVDNIKSTREEIHEGVKFIWIKTPQYRKNDLKRVINILVFTIKLFFVLPRNSKPDVIVGSSIHPFGCLAALIISKFKKTNYYLEIRDLWPQTLIDMGLLSYNNIISKFLRLLEKILYNSAKKIIILLPDADKYIYNLDQKFANKIVYIPNGVSLEKFDKNKKIFKKSIIEKNNLNNKFIVMYTGAHGLVNKLDIIIKAAIKIQKKRLNDIHFVFIGDGPQKDKLIEMSSNYNISNVTFEDSVEKNYIPYILSEANINIITIADSPLYKYGISPNKLFDYFASSKPIIMSGNVSNDLVSIAKSGITVEPENPQKLADAIIKMRNMPQEDLNEMGRNGRKYVEKNHEIKILAEKFEQTICKK